jgi:ankyrin repeat protein
MSADFFKAIKQGKLDEVRRLLFMDPELIHAKENGLSPILVAAYHQEADIASFLAERTVALTIFEAAATGNRQRIIHHLAHNPELVNAYSEDGFQPLGLACFFGHLEAAEYLIKAGALVNSPSRNSLQATPLQSATAARHTKIVMMLLGKGADPNCREQGGYTPLHTAAQNGDLDIIRALLFNGADMNITSSDGKTPLDLAVEAGHVEVAKLFKEGITRRFRAMRQKS